MAEQLHKRFSDEEVKQLMQRHKRGEIRSGYLMKILGLRRTRFFELVNIYRSDPDVETGMAEIRFWYRDNLLDVQSAKNEDINLVRSYFLSNTFSFQDRYCQNTLPDFFPSDHYL